MTRSARRTPLIAERFGARVVKRVFDNWSAHQNWGLRNLQFKHSWVFYIDADERMTPQLAASVKSVAGDAGDCVAFRVQRRDFFMDTWLKHAQNSPYYLRLFRPEKMRYERLVNPVSVADGPVGSVAGYWIIFPSAKESVTVREAQFIQHAGSPGRLRRIGRDRVAFSLHQAFTAADFNVRRFIRRNSFIGLPSGRW